MTRPKREGREGEGAPPPAVLAFGPLWPSRFWLSRSPQPSHENRKRHAQINRHVIHCVYTGDALSSLFCIAYCDDRTMGVHAPSANTHLLSPCASRHFPLSSHRFGTWKHGGQSMLGDMLPTFTFPSSAEHVAMACPPACPSRREATQPPCRRPLLK